MTRATTRVSAERNPPSPFLSDQTDLKSLKGTALILEDDEFDAAVTQELLEKYCSREFAVERASELKDAVALLSRSDFNVALIDMNLPDSQGLETVRQAVQANPSVPIIVITGDEDLDTAIAALKIGAQDYLPKSLLDSKVLQRVIEYAVQRKLKEDTLTTKAYFDTLTGLANRALLYDRWCRSLARSQRSGKKAGLLIADIDSFKQVNDRFGHNAGDSVLIDFSESLKASVRQTDVVARLGGDEFVIVLENIEREDDVLQIRDTIVAKMPFAASDGPQTIPYTASIGCTISDPSLEEDLMAVLRRADSEMYKIKAVN